jgi:hypothetical protein
MKIKSFKEKKKLFSSGFTGIIERCDGAEDPYLTWAAHYKNGREHRENGPAVEYSDGDKRWFLNGKGCKDEEDWKIEVEKLKK